MLLLNAVGAAIGSFIRWAMRSAEGEILFTLMAIACALFAAFIAIQPKGATAVATEEQSTRACDVGYRTRSTTQDPRAGYIA